MKKVIYTILLTLGIVFSFTPLIIKAEETPCPTGQYCLLEPLQIGDKVFKEFAATTPISGYVNIMFKIIIGVVGVLAVVMLVLGGVQYMSTDAISGKESGKETIQHALGGLVLALGAFIILNTINPDILSLNIGIEPVTVVVGNDDIPLSVEISQNSDGSGSKVKGLCSQSKYLNGIAIVDGMTWPSDSVERGQLTSGTGITINKSNCTKVVDKHLHPNDPALSCTTVLEMPSSVISGLKTVKTSCDTFNGGSGKCSLIVTGGTECWQHATHGPELLPVDISATSSFNWYVLSDNTKTKSFPNDGKTYTKDGHSYVAEKAGSTGNTTGAHWHMKN